jgi:hypothetical protein
MHLMDYFARGADLFPERHWREPRWAGRERQI